MAILSIISFAVLINFYILNYSKDYFININSLEKSKVWLVLWAWIKYNKEPTDILKDRLQTAFEAYKSWKIKKIIVSGDNSKIYHNEPEVMEKYLLNLWVNKNDIFKDYAWFDTYDSIYRAKEIFWVKKLIIFTQEYHLYRALYIANRLWINSFWIATNRHNYILIKKFKSREFLSRIKAFFEVEILKTKPKFLGEKIEIK
jgi:vancomycin permeability regulator SanA